MYFTYVGLIMFILHWSGEYFSRELCWYLLTILSGHSIEDRALMNEDDFSFLPEVSNSGDINAY